MATWAELGIDPELVEVVKVMDYNRVVDVGLRVNMELSYGDHSGYATVVASP